MTDVLKGLRQLLQPMPDGMRYAKPGPYTTTLPPGQEQYFQQWVQANNVPWKDVPNADYDMRGFYQALQNRDPRTVTAVNANDGKLHFNDAWKTPHHKSFSRESIYAAQGAPSWNQRDQLQMPNGQVVFDEPVEIRRENTARLMPGLRRVLR